MTKEECKKYLQKSYFEYNPYMWVGTFLINALVAFFYFNFEYHKIVGLITLIALYFFIWNLRTKENFLEVEKYLKELEERDAKMVKFREEEE